MTPLLAAYATGLLCLAVLYAQHRVDARKVRRPEPRKAIRPTPYVGRHWADGLSTSQRVAAAVAEREAKARALLGATHEMFLPDFDGDVGEPYQPPARSDHYVQLRQRVLDARAHVDLTALRLRTSTMPRVEEHDDEWVSVA